MIKTISLWFALMCIYIHSYCQELKYFTSTNSTQRGIAAKASFELAEYKKFTFRLGISAGIGSFILGDDLYGSLHADLMFYNNGFGSTKHVLRKPQIVPDFILAGTLTTGGKSRLNSYSTVRPGIRNYPLYYFSNFTRPPLQNPYRSSFSLGSNIAFNPTHKHPFQQIGFLNIHIGQFQFSYFNDGTPFQWTLQGDGRDRYYTGGGTVTFTLPAKIMIDNLEFSYHKYSGYVPDAFEIANMLDLSFLNYADDKENGYNKSMLTLSGSSSTHHFQVGVSAVNQTEWDIQHRIHQKIFNAFHRVPHPPHFTPRASLYISNTKIGLQ